LTEAGIYRKCEDIWDLFTIDNQIPSNHSFGAIAIDQHGRRWFGFENGIATFDGTSWQTVPPPEGSNSFYDLEVDKKNQIWAGTPFGVYVLTATQWSTLTVNDGLAANTVMAIAFDNQGGQWFGTSDGISYHYEDTWQTYTTTHGLANSTTFDLALDNQGDIWAATYKGVSHFDGHIWETYTTTHGLLDEQVHTLAIDPYDNIWVGSELGVSVFDGQTWITYSDEEGLRRSIHAITFDHLGQAWVGTGAGVFRYDGEVWESFLPYGSIHYGGAAALAFDSSNHLWVADVGIFEFIPDALETVITPEEGGELIEGTQLQTQQVTQESGLALNNANGVNLSFDVGAVETDLDLMYIPHSNADLSGFPGVIRSFELYGLAGGTSAPQVIDTSSAYQMSIHYSDFDALVFKESTFQLYYWDGNVWVLEPTQQLDQANNIVSATPKSLTHYILAGEPNPEARILFLPLILP
jgi:hypothetical protein